MRWPCPVGRPVGACGCEGARVDVPIGAVDVVVTVDDDTGAVAGVEPVAGPP